MATSASASSPQYMRDVTLNPASIDAATVSSETFTVAGLATDMVVTVNAPNIEAGLFVIHANVSAANTLKLAIWNTTGAPVNPASQVFKVIAH